MSDVIAFLRARLDDDEKIANAAARRVSEWRSQDGYVGGGGEPYVDDWSGDEPLTRYDGEATIVYDEGWPEEVEATHIARHDPARVLRDVAAKRLIIEVELRNLEAIDGEWGCGCTADEIRAGKCAGRGRSESKTFRGLAAVYSDHPDYRKEWQI